MKVSCSKKDNVPSSDWTQMKSLPTHDQDPLMAHATRLSPTFNLPKRAHHDVEGTVGQRVLVYQEDVVTGPML